MLSAVASALVPGRWVTGYVTGGDGKRLRYHLNGLRVFVLVMGAYAVLGATHGIPWDFFYLHRWSLLGTAFVIGLVFTFAIVLPAASLTVPAIVAAPDRRTTSMRSGVLPATVKPES